MTIVYLTRIVQMVLNVWSVGRAVIALSRLVRHYRISAMDRKAAPNELFLSVPIIRCYRFDYCIDLHDIYKFTNCCYCYTMGCS